MKKLFENIKSIAQKRGYDFLTIKMKETFWEYFISISIGDTEFIIQKKLFGGYDIKHKTPNLSNPVVISISDEHDTDIWHIIQVILFGEIKYAESVVDEIESDYRKLDNKEDIKEAYDDNEGSNLHMGNILLLAIHFGTEEDIKKVKEAMVLNELAGYMYQDDGDVHERLYPKLERE